MHMKALLVLILVLSLMPSAFASPIYKWKDKNGIVHYSSKQTSPQAKPADLPKIMRTKSEAPKVDLSNCKSHGGVNCRLGPDKDGSVICYDGFAEASTRFIFSCSSPKLEIADVSAPDKDGNFTVFVRNTTSVEARGAEVFYISRLLANKTKLDGPSQIDSFGVAEFYFQPESLRKEQRPKQVLAGDLKLSCENCS